MKSQKRLPLEFKRYLVLFNPASTNAVTTKRRIDKLRLSLPDREFYVIETLPDRKQNMQLIVNNSDKLGRDTLLCIGGGDGTTNLVIETLLTARGLSPNDRQTPIFPMWGGNANDLAHMLNGSPHVRFETILRRGNIVPIHPLQIEMTNKEEGSRMHIAACYAGFGATAFAALKLNKPTHRLSKLHSIPGGRLLQEIITVAGALLEAPSFAVEESDHVSFVYERTFANGSRMAKLHRLPVQLTDQMFYINTLENRRLVSAIPRMMELTRKRLAAKFLRNYAHFTTQEPSWAHFDGEPLPVPAHTRVQVQLSTRPFYALSTALHVKEQ